MQVLSAKRYDLEGFADYAHFLRESHSFQAKELGNITFVLKIHSILQRQGIEVPPQDKVRNGRDGWAGGGGE